MLLLFWRALRGKLPTNEKLVSFGYDSHDCCYCYRQSSDTIDHLFINGNFVVNVWKFFPSFCGIHNDRLPLHHYVMKWWNAEYKNKAHRFLLHVVPIFVWSNLWKNRCSSKYARKQSNFARVKYLVIKNMQLLFKSVYPQTQWPTNWKDMTIFVEKCSHKLKIIPVH